MLVEDCYLLLLGLGGSAWRRSGAVMPNSRAIASAITLPSAFSRIDSMSAPNSGFLQHVREGENIALSLTQTIAERLLRTSGAHFLMCCLWTCSCSSLTPRGASVSLSASSSCETQMTKVVKRSSKYAFSARGFLEVVAHL